MTKKLLLNAQNGIGSSNLNTSEFRINFEYLSVIEDLNRIYQSHQNSSSFIRIQSGTDSGIICIQADAYLLSFLLTGEDLLDYNSISLALDGFSLTYLTKNILLETLIDKKQLNLIDLIKDHFASLNQRFFIYWSDLEENEYCLEVFV